jgi:hypothetical protein
MKGLILAALLLVPACDRPIQPQTTVPKILWDGPLEAGYLYSVCKPQGKDCIAIKPQQYGDGTIVSADMPAPYIKATSLVLRTCFVSDPDTCTLTVLR